MKILEKKLIFFEIGPWRSDEAPAGVASARSGLTETEYKILDQRDIEMGALFIQANNTKQSTKALAYSIIYLPKSKR
ncbi:MAG: hypothetical protein QNJ54_26780 [Prochloraceae cyanobacterium]|nr:hypothetical protein [Prochloraceae cyanobacterium]